MGEPLREHFQGPTDGLVAEGYGELLAIVTHPAFRLGFLDAQLGRPFEHDRIMDRIDAETPASALARIGWKRNNEPAGLFDTPEPSRRARVEIAQYRYEEGRLLVVSEGLRCKAWGHPDYPPRQVDDFIWKRAQASAA